MSALSRPPASADSIALAVIARYLQRRGFSSAHDALLAEAGPSDDALRAPELSWLIAGWQAGERANELARSAQVDESAALSIRCTARLPKVVTTTLTTIHAANILVVQPYILRRRVFDTALADYRDEAIDCLLTTATDKTIKLTSLATHEVEEIFEPVKSPTLAVVVDPMAPEIIYSGAMDGSISVTNVDERQTTSTIKAHAKHVVALAISPSGRCLSSAGADGRVVLFARPAPGQIEVTSTVKLASPPTALVFLPDESRLVVGRRADCHLHAYVLPSIGEPMPSELVSERYNLNANEDSHVSFSPVTLSIHPLGRHLAFQTDTSLARVMIVPLPLRPASTAAPLTLYTQAEQDDYFTPRHAWLPDGSAVVVSSADGVVRIVDLEGKIRSAIPAHGAAAPVDAETTARELHELTTAGSGTLRPGSASLLKTKRESMVGSSVVRDVCVLSAQAGAVTVVSVGFDRTLRIATAT